MISKPTRDCLGRSEPLASQNAPVRPMRPTDLDLHCIQPNSQVWLNERPCRIAGSSIDFRCLTETVCWYDGPHSSSRTRKAGLSYCSSHLMAFISKYKGRGRPQTLHSYPISHSRLTCALHSNPSLSLVVLAQHKRDRDLEAQPRTSLSNLNLNIHTRAQHASPITPTMADANDSDSSALSEHSDHEVAKLAPIFLKAKKVPIQIPKVSPPRQKRPPSPPHEETLADHPAIPVSL